jgi:hypothetical protein
VYSGDTIFARLPNGTYRVLKMINGFAVNEDTDERYCLCDLAGWINTDNIREA